jgi:pre-mRNA-splicing factor SYF1
LLLNLELWSLYIDLERNFGTFETIKAAYKKAIEIKIVTPIMLLNYAEYLEANHYYEDSFKIYENGIGLFTWPSLYNIWLTYLYHFIKRYEG